MAFGTTEMASWNHSIFVGDKLHVPPLYLLRTELLVAFGPRGGAENGNVAA